jgi:TPR repeat protein
VHLDPEAIAALSRVLNTLAHSRAPLIWPIGPQKLLKNLKLNSFDTRPHIAYLKNSRKILSEHGTMLDRAALRGDQQAVSHDFAVAFLLFIAEENPMLFHSAISFAHDAEDGSKDTEEQFAVYLMVFLVSQIDPEASLMPLMRHHMRSPRLDLDRVELDIRRRADSGDETAIRALGEFLSRSGRVYEAIQLFLRAARGGDEGSAAMLVELLSKRVPLEQAIRWLRTEMYEGNSLAESLLLGFLLENNQREEAIDMMVTMNPEKVTSDHIAKFLTLSRDTGDLGQVIVVLETLASAGHSPAAMQLAELYRGLGDIARAVAVLEHFDPAEHGAIAMQLAELYGKSGNIPRAIALLEVRASAGDAGAAMQLAELYRG